MLQLKTLLSLEDARVIVVDEGLNAPYGKYLVVELLRQQEQVQRRRNGRLKIEILSFADPLYRCTAECGTFYAKSATVHDCCTLDPKNVDKVEADVDRVESVINTIDRESTIVVDCLNTFILNVGVAKCFKLLKKIVERSSRLICMYKRNFMTGDKVTPLIETLGTTYVRLSDCSSRATSCDTDKIVYTATMIHRKAGGSMLRQTKSLTQSIVTYDIIDETNVAPNGPTLERPNTDHDPKIESSFRIQISEREMEQRNKTSLPYTISANSTASKILYQPEDIDDLDEEDPDDDLCF